jgi:hypothetical protein
MFAYLLIYGDMYWRTTLSFLDFITDNVMLDFKCTLVWNIGLALVNKVYHCWIPLANSQHRGKSQTGTYPCGTSFVIMRYLSWIGNPSS